MIFEVTVTAKYLDIYCCHAYDFTLIDLRLAKNNPSLQRIGVRRFKVYTIDYWYKASTMANNISVSLRTF
jgi:hypothetical protein